jgi:hypothetical protein
MAGMGGFEKESHVGSGNLHAYCILVFGADFTAG